MEVATKIYDFDDKCNICRIVKGKLVVADYELLIIADALDVPVTDLLVLSGNS